MKKFLTSDTAMKIYSVLIAMLLWGFVVINQNPTSTKPVAGINVFCTNIDALEQSGLTILQNENLKAMVEVRGKRLSIAKVDRTNVSASFTVPELKEGTYEVPVDIKLPINDVYISDKSPYTTTVVVEKQVESTFQIDVLINGASAEEKAKLRTVLSAQEVVLKGPVSVMETVESVSVTINKSDVARTMKVDLMILNKEGEDISEDINLQKSFSSVNVTLLKVVSAHTPVSAVTEGTPAKGYEIGTITIKPDSVLLGTVQNSDTWLSAIHTEPISIEGASENVVQKVSLILPAEYELMEDVAEVEVTVEILPESKDE